MCIVRETNQGRRDTSFSRLLLLLCVCRSGHEIPHVYMTRVTTNSHVNTSRDRTSKIKIDVSEVIHITADDENNKRDVYVHTYNQINFLLVKS